MSTRTDLTPLAIIQMPWSPDDFVQSIAALADEVRTKANEAISWYVHAKKPKRAGATVIRSLTIASTTSAGILTVLAQLYDGVPNGELKIHPVWISMALAVAAGLFGIDKFFGFSRGWIRYVSTELKIRTALDEFNMSWPMRVVDWENGIPNAAQAKEAIVACTSFRAEIDTLVKDETDKWIADFQASIKDLDASTKTAEKAAQAAVEKYRKQEEAEKSASKTD